MIIPATPNNPQQPPATHPFPAFFTHQQVFSHLHPGLQTVSWHTPDHHQHLRIRPHIEPLRTILLAIGGHGLQGAESEIQSKTCREASTDHYLKTGVGSRELDLFQGTSILQGTSINFDFFYLDRRELFLTSWKMLGHLGLRLLLFPSVHE